MKRTSLDLPECLPFQARLRARITDMNYGGHMGYDALVGILQAAHRRRNCALVPARRKGARRIAAHPGNSFEQNCYTVGVTHPKGALTVV